MNGFLFLENYTADTTIWENLKWTITSWGGTSNDTVLKSTLLYWSIFGTTKNNPENLNWHVSQNIWLGYPKRVQKTLSRKERVIYYVQIHDWKQRPYLVPGPHRGVFSQVWRWQLFHIPVLSVQIDLSYNSLSLKLKFSKMLCYSNIIHCMHSPSNKRTMKMEMLPRQGYSKGQ